VKVLSYDVHFSELLKGSAVSFFFRILGLGLGYVFTLLIAKWYGAAEMGFFALSFTILNICTTFGLLGFETAILKLLSKYQDDVLQAYVIYKKIVLMSVGTSILLSIVLYLLKDFIAVQVFKNKILSDYFFYILFAIVPYVLLKINASVMRSFKDIVSFSFFYNGGYFVFILILFVSFYTFDIDMATILSFVFGIIMTYLMTQYIIYKRFSFTTKISRISSYVSNREILKLSLPMLITNSLILVMGWTDSIMLGYFVSKSDVGIYFVVLKLATLLSITLIAINSIATPKFADFYHNGEMKGLENFTQKSTNLIFFSSIPIMLIYGLFPEFILSFFGKEFVVGYIALWILSIGQFVNALSGSVGSILNMTGNEKIFSRIMLFSAFLNILLNYILIPKYGMNGAAIATAISMSTWNVLAILFVKIKLNIWVCFNPLKLKK
jgi:O-antigen/teichoic acid export membrane protein